MSNQLPNRSDFQCIKAILQWLIFKKGKKHDYTSYRVFIAPIDLVTLACFEVKDQYVQKCYNNLLLLNLCK